jgi:hypothetical protein
MALITLKSYDRGTVVINDAFIITIQEDRDNPDRCWLVMNQPAGPINIELPIEDLYRRLTGIRMSVK